ncbi:SubName: Full=Uncharacterized protein {ECO:0000313/EMBL:CCA70191.1} [Serendipita indica DSM 11827]|nr:SubName: Full=Uncharacterized protein {ECO:0000313/EMBL:CCA70191.1} [Serendipita indica DSM 11827]
MKVAVIGSGCSGLAATWALNEYSGHQVDLYEADATPGGHAHSVKFINPQNGKEVMVDTAFMVFTPSAYPNFTRLLRLLNVNVLDTSMSWSVTRNEGEFEWASHSVFTLFSQSANLFNSRLWRMLWDIMRFNASARRFIATCETSDTVNNMSIGDYLNLHGYSDTFRDDYLLPLTAAIWSTSPNVCANDYTMQSVLRYLHNHHMLQIFGKPVWRTIAGGRHVHHYVHQITSNLPPDALKLATRVSSVAPTIKDGKQALTVTTESGVSKVYDHVIMACQSYASRDILKKGGFITPEEERILGGFSWTKNEAVLHADESALALQKDMPSIQNKRGISFAGAWMGFAFHEDGITAGLEAATALGVRLPFELSYPDRRVKLAWLAEVFDVLEFIRRLLSVMCCALYSGFWSIDPVVVMVPQSKAA